MNRPELVNWLESEYQQWEALLEQIGPENMERPGVNGEWSMKDIAAHLTGWQRILNTDASNCPGPPNCAIIHP